MTGDNQHPGPPPLGLRITRIRLGQELQQRRIAQNLTQTELAARIGKSLKYVGEIERGEANPTLEVIERYADVVGWDPMDFLQGRQETMTEGVRRMIIVEIQPIITSLASIVKWLHALDPGPSRPAPPAPPARKRLQLKGRNRESLPPG